jgi:hypothetical protein
MKIAKPYKSNWYFFVIFVLVVLAFGSYVYFSKGKMFRNFTVVNYPEGMKSNSKGTSSTTCPAGYVNCVTSTPATNYACANICVEQGWCDPNCVL